MVVILPKGVISAVVGMFKEIIRGKKKKAKSLKVLGDKKFKELQATHTLFIQMLRNILDASEAAVMKSEKTNDLANAERVLIDAILDVEKRRFQRHDVRRQNLAEARVYSERELSNIGIFKTMPEDIAELLRSMMSAYVEYFSVSDLYSHELGRALFEIRSSVIVLKKQNDRFSSSKRDLRKKADQVKLVTRDAIARSKKKWEDVATSYYKLNFALQEHGYI